MRKCLVLLGTGLLLHAILAVGCAEGEEGANVFIPDTDASVEAASTGGAGGDASTEAGKEGGAGTSGSAGASGASGSAGSSGSSGASGAAGSGGSSTGGSSTGGSSTGGSSTGGSSTGGSSTGGSSTGGSSTGGSGTGGASGAPPYSHTITIGSGNDFNADETFVTTSSGYTGYISWDATHVFVGMDGADVGSNNASRFFLVYISGTPGTNLGQVYGTQSPQLPFNARWHIRWKADGSFTGAREWDGSQWVDKTWDFAGHVAKSGNYVELAIERQTLGYPAKVAVHLSMINETAGNEWTFAGVPSTSWTPDGYDPNYSKYYEFDLQSPKAPNDYLPLP